jgi:hypothetical protein
LYIQKRKEICIMTTLDLEADKARLAKKARPISREVQDLVIGELPADMDVKNETEKMWEELAQ